jgi:hypothetical protein
VGASICREMARFSEVIQFFAHPPEDDRAPRMPCKMR